MESEGLPTPRDVTQDDMNLIFSEVGEIISLSGEHPHLIMIFDTSTIILNTKSLLMVTLP
jgi:hypothetical protein